MKKIIVAGIFLFASGSLYAQIPTTDVALNAQTGMNQVATMAQWAQQILEMKMQYEQMTTDFALMQQDYASATGSRGLGNTNYNGAISGAITDVASMYSGGGQTQSVIDEEALKNQGDYDATQKQIEDRQILAAASQKAASLKAYGGAQQRLSQIESLMGQINSTNDPKSIQELQARISIEQSTLQNEQNKLSIISQSHASELALIEEQKRALSRKILNPNNTAMPSIH